jgi:hypothetical protein
MACIHEELRMPPAQSFMDDECLPLIHIQEESVTPCPLLFNDQVEAAQKRPHDVDGGERSEVKLDHSGVDEEPWEAEVQGTLMAQVEICSWKELHEQSENKTLNITIISNQSVDDPAKLCNTVIEGKRMDISKFGDCPTMA